MAARNGGQTDLAEAELIRLAEANKVGLEADWEFHEWINSETGQPSGAKFQSWNAGTFIMAYQALREEKSLLVFPSLM